MNTTLLILAGILIWFSGFLRGWFDRTRSFDYVKARYVALKSKSK